MQHSYVCLYFSLFFSKFIQIERNPNNGQQIQFQVLMSNIYLFNSFMLGPAAHPLFGNFMTMSELDQIPYKAFDFLTQKHGPIVRLVFGPSILVNLGGYREIKDAMNNELLDDYWISC